MLKDTATEIEDKYKVKVNYETLDIRASSDVESYIDGIFQEGPLDGLVNNAAGILFHLLKIYLIKDLMQ